MSLWPRADNLEKLFTDRAPGMPDFNVYFAYETNVDDAWIPLMNMDIGP